MNKDIFTFSRCLRRWSSRRTFVILLALAAGLPGTARAQVYDRPTYSSPIAISRDDKLIFAVNPGDDSVTVVRPDNNTAITKISVGDEPQSVTLTPDGQYAYVANARANSVSVIHIDNPAWGTFSATVVTNFITGAEPWNIVSSPDGRRIFVANSSQDTITIIDATTRSLIGQVDLRNSIANDPDRTRHFQPRGLAVTADSSKLYVTRFLSFTRPGGQQGDDFGREGLVAVLDINTSSANLGDYHVARVVPLAPQIETIAGGNYALQGKPTINATWSSIGPVVQGAGGRTNLLVNIDSAAQFLRLVAAP